MQITPKENIKDFKLPLPIYETVHIADAVSRDGEKFSLVVGMDKNIVLDLKKKSLDESDTDIQNNTSDRKRFGEGSYEEWYSKKRTPFVLIHKDTNALSAIVWFGPKELRNDGNNWQAVGWRSYSPFRGKGIMKEFSKFSMNIYMNHVQDAKFWGVLKRGNEGSLSLGLALGFVAVDEESDEESIVMIK